MAVLVTAAFYLELNPAMPKSAIYGPIVDPTSDIIKFP